MDCEIVGCDKPVHVKKRGLCVTHYARWARDNKPRSDKRCDVGECQKPHYAKGYCERHYGLYKRHGKPERITKANAVCVGPECDRKATGRGMCDAHYMQWYAGKELTVLKPFKHRVIDSAGNHLCRNCNTFKAPTEFYLSKGVPRYFCKPCVGARQKARKAVKK